MQPRTKGRRTLPKGLHVQKRKGGDYWLVQTTVDGRRVSRSIGYVSRREATRVYFQLMEKMQRGATPSPYPNGISLGLFLETYYLPKREDDGKAPKTIALDRVNAGHLLAYFGPERSIESIHTRDVELFKAWRRRHGGWKYRNKKGELTGVNKIRPTARTINLDLRVLRLALQYAKKLDFIARLPEIDSLDEAAERRPSKFHTREEMEKVLAVANEHLLLLLLAYHTGMRPGEVLSRTWDDVNLVGSEINICDRLPSFKCKSDSARVVPMTDRLKGAFESVPEGQRFGKLFQVKHMKSPLRRACQRAGVKVINPNATRHTFATLAAEDGMERGALRAVMGHCDSKMLDEIYQHVRIEHVRRQVAKLSFGRDQRTGTVVPMVRHA